MKKLLFLLTTLIMPITVFAATEIGRSDLDEAKLNSGEVTAKGIRYQGNASYGCFHFSDGDYKISENLNLNNEKLCFLEVTANLDLNNKLITFETDDPDFGAYPIHFGASDLTITGNGTINGGTIKGDGGGTIIIKNGTFNGNVETRATELIIEGGTFNGDVTAEGAEHEQMGSVHIKSGTFNGDIYFDNIVGAVIDNAKSTKFLAITNTGSLTINDGEFYGVAEQALYTDQVSEVIINGGYFEAYVAADIENSNSVEINGGTFVGYLGALGISYPDIDPQTVLLKGGTFKATGLGQNLPYGAIIYVDSQASDEAENFILTWVADGFKYDPEAVVEVAENLGSIVVYATQNEISVVPIEYEEEEIVPDKKEESKKEDKKKDENPKTLDNVGLYAIITAISALGLITIRKCKKD